MESIKITAAEFVERENKIIHEKRFKRQQEIEQARLLEEERNKQEERARKEAEEQMIERIASTAYDQFMGRLKEGNPWNGGQEIIRVYLVAEYKTSIPLEAFVRTVHKIQSAGFVARTNETYRGVLEVVVQRPANLLLI